MLFKFNNEKYVEKYNLNKNYGLGYVGSKNLIVEKLVKSFPNADNFYNLFAGGGSVTHYAIVAKKYKNYYMNDLDPQPIELFKKALNGDFKNENRWISREDFFKLKDSDAYVAYCWSFGNDGKTYLYGKEIEPYKKACYYAIAFDDWKLLEELCPEVVDDAKKALLGVTYLKLRRLRLGNILKKKISLGQLQNLLNLERLYNIERLGQLQRVINFSNKSYDEIKIKENSVIYCDISYKDTVNKYKFGNFDYCKFYEWCRKQTEPLFISSYDLPVDRFICVKEFEKNCTLQSGGNNKKIEKLYIPKHQTYDCGGLF